MQILTVHTISQQASNQAAGYCNALREGGIQKLDATTRLFRVAIVGVGKNMLSTTIREYKST